MISGGKRWRRYRGSRAVDMLRNYLAVHSIFVKLTVPLAPQRMKEQGGKKGAGALAAEGVVLRRLEEFARLMIGDRRRLAFAAPSLWPLDALRRVMGHRILVAEIFEQRRQRREPVSDRAAAEASAREFVAPGDDVRARDDPKFFRPADAGKAHKVLHGGFVRATRARVRKIGEPLSLKGARRRAGG